MESNLKHNNIANLTFFVTLKPMILIVTDYKVNQNVTDHSNATTVNYRITVSLLYIAYYNDISRFYYRC